MKLNNKLSLATVLTLTLLVLTSQVIIAQTCDSTGVRDGEHRKGFIDEDGDGHNDNARDHDSDGIPNGQDPDYVKSETGQRRGFIDTDGDGINDLMQDFDGDGIANGKDPDYIRPRDGNGRKTMQGLHTNSTRRGMQQHSGTRTCGTSEKSSARRGGNGRGR